MAKTQSAGLFSSTYASREKALLSLVQQLRAIGAQAYLDVPRIVISGNQSAGKSSVVEAVSGITVPRDSGTCTRCPMECRLSRSDREWSCQVSIRWEFTADGQPCEKVSEVPFGGRITHKGEVELALRRAQAAVLSPDVSFEDILEMDAEELRDGSLMRKKSLPFSRNVVCVDLEGPDLTNLSFIDLPGIIQNADPEVVTFVEELVVSHIKGNCLILVALPMSDDIENQKALRLARREDPAGTRTIGVITKPDMLSAGSTKTRSLWLDIIEGRRHPLAHGYYCTRQPDDAERSESISHAEARQRETAFFESTQPWSTSLHQHRFGTPNLISRLSELLVRIINNSLPKLQQQTSSLLEACHGELDKLPKLIDMEPATYMLHLITALCEDVQQYVRGGTNTARLIQEHKAAYAKFKIAIWSTAPNFLPFEDNDQHMLMLRDNPNEAVDEGPADTRFYLNDMRQHIESSITRELVNSVPFDAKLTLIIDFQATWKQSVRICFDSVRVSMSKVLEECVDKKFKTYETLCGHMRLFASDFVKEQETSCQTFLDAILEAELTPFTLNHHYLQSSTEKWLTKYKEVRSPKNKRDGGNNLIQSGLPHDNSVNQALAALANLGFVGLTKEDLAKLYQADEYETELKVMAEVRGYFKVAYKRIVDNVPSLIDLKFVKAIGALLQPFLIAQLGLGTPNATAHCESYLAEDPTIVARRAELVAQKTRLESIEREFLRSGL